MVSPPSTAGSLLRGLSVLNGFLDGAIGTFLAHSTLDVAFAHLVRRMAPSIPSCDDGRTVENFGNFLQREAFRLREEQIDDDSDKAQGSDIDEIILPSDSFNRNRIYESVECKCDCVAKVCKRDAFLARVEGEDFRGVGC